MLYEVITDFSRNTSPIWMDSSTSKECREITDSLGGDRQVARLTGSIASERFAAPQIRKFWKEKPAAYAKTSHIALISSFITSLLVGSVVALSGIVSFVGLIVPHVLRRTLSYNFV